jgi:hypothetical protein
LDVKLTDGLGFLGAGFVIGAVGCGVGGGTGDGAAVDGDVGTCGVGGVGRSSPGYFHPTGSRWGLVRGPNFVFIGLSLRCTIGNTFAPRRALMFATASQMCSKAKCAPIVGLAYVYVSPVAKSIR